MSCISTPRYSTTTREHYFQHPIGSVFLLFPPACNVRGIYRSVYLAAKPLSEFRNSGAEWQKRTDKRGGKTLPDRWSGNAVTRLVARSILMCAISQPSGSTGPPSRVKSRPDEPYLGRRDDDPSALNYARLHVVRESCQNTLQGMRARLLSRISSSNSLFLAVQVSRTDVSQLSVWLYLSPRLFTSRIEDTDIILFIIYFIFCYYECA